MLHKLLFVFLTLLAFSSTCLAEVFFYTDTQGRTHFVSTREKVPEEFRSQLDGQKLAPISKSKAPRYQKQRYVSSYSSGGRVVMYTTKYCGACRRAEKFLKKNRIPYTNYDIHSSKRAKSEYAKLGGGGVPLIKIGSTVMRGFSPQGIMAALKK